MRQKQFLQIINHIINLIEDAGYSAEKQIIAYALTGDDSYITRHGDARIWIHKLEIDQIKEFFEIY